MFVIYDLEYTSWVGAQDNGWSEPGQAREIVAAGALLVDEDLAVVDEREWVVRPARNPIISDFLAELTGLTQAQVDAGVELPQFHAEFCAFCRTYPALSYGNDMVIIGENIGGWHGGLGAFRAPLPSMINIRPYLNLRHPETAPLNAGKLLRWFEPDQPDDVQEHDALGDCRAILAALRHDFTQPDSPLRDYVRVFAH